MQKISTPPHCVLAIEQVLREFITEAKVYPGRPRLAWMFPWENSVDTWSLILRKEQPLPCEPCKQHTGHTLKKVTNEKQTSQN